MWRRARAALYNLLTRGQAHASQYEKSLSLAENCTFFANRTWEKGVATVDVDALSLDDIYSHAIGFVPGNSGKAVEVVVVRSQC